MHGVSCILALVFIAGEMTVSCQAVFLVRLSKPVVIFGNSHNKNGMEGGCMRTIVRGLSACILAGLAAPLWAGDSPSNQYRLEIKRQPVVAALAEFSRQTGLQVTYLPKNEQEEGTIAAELKGQYTAEAGLQELLAPSGLSFERVNEKTLVVMAPRSRFERIALVGDGEKSGSWRRLRLAEAEVASSTGRADQQAAEGSSARQKTPDRVEEVIVTAQKRDELLKDVPISITALSGDNLDRSSMEGVLEALTTVPGVAAMEWRNGMGRQLSVRGVTSGGPWFDGSAPIGYYVDSTPFSFVRSGFSPDAGAYDLERVEVLRGPQGTLYGASSLNGVVRILTKEADLDEFGFKSRLSGSTTEGGSGSYRGDMAVNVPLIEGKLAARLTAGHEDLSGWIDRPGRENVNDANTDTVRLKLRAKPTEQLTVDLSGWWYRSDLDAPNTGEDNNTHASLFTEPSSADFDTFALKLGYEFAAFAVSSSSSYMDFVGRSQLDFSPYCCAPLRLDTDLTGHFFVQEILASSTTEGPWHWSLGGYYRDARDRTSQNFVDAPVLQAWEDTSESWAVFGEVSRLLLDGRLELTAGLRYFEDRVGTATIVSPVGPDFRPSGSDDFDSLTPRFVITGHVNEDFLVYVSYSEGFRSGLLQTAAAAAAGLPPAQPDTLKNYEVGTKVTLWGNRLSVDTSVYYIEWKDAFVTGPLVFLPIGGVDQAFGISRVNGPSRSGMGVDLAVTAHPTDGLTVGFNLSVNDLKADKDWVVPGVGIVAAKDERLDNSPAETYGVFADYEFPLGQSGFTGAFSASGNYLSDVTQSTTTPGGDTLLVYESDPQLISRASFAIRSPSNWVTMMFVNNLNNERGVAAPNNFATPSWDARPRPRTYGVQLECRF